MSIKQIHTVHVAVRVWAEDDKDAIEAIHKLLDEQRVVQGITSHNIYRVTNKTEESYL